MKNNVIEFPNTSVPTDTTEKIDCGAGFCTKYAVYAYVGEKPVYTENEKVTISISDTHKEALIDFEEGIPEKGMPIPDVLNSKPLAGLEIAELLIENGDVFKTRVLAIWQNED